MKDERIDAVINNLSSLILSHSRMTAVEQYCPGADVDRSEDVQAEHKEWVTELRRIRTEFENLVTGIIE